MTKSTEAFRTISEVAEALDTPAHVLRFWESRFPQVKPVKRAGGRRYYRPADVALLAGIRKLLHEDGLTIRGVQKMLRERGVRHVADGYGLDGPALPEGDDPERDLPDPAGAAPAAATGDETAAPPDTDLPEEDADVTDLALPALDPTSRASEAPGTRARAALAREREAAAPAVDSAPEPGQPIPAAALVRAMTAGRAAENRAALRALYRRLQALRDARLAAGHRARP